MLRNFLLLVIGVIGLAIVRNVIREIGKVVARSMRPAKPAGSHAKREPKGSRNLVRDPHTGTYVDPAHAVRAKVGGKVHYFESEASRDAYLASSA